MKLAAVGYRPRGAFTLVELITVVAILAILITIVIGGYGGLKNYQAEASTSQMMNTLDAGLRQYYADYSFYPWVDTTIAANVSLKTGCGDFKPTDTSILPTTGASGVGTFDQPQAVLYSTLNARHGHGGAMPGGAQQTMAKHTISSTTGAVIYTYWVYVDGWGREIYYWPADLAASPPSTVRPPRTAADGSAIKFVMPDAQPYQCPIHGWVKSATPTTCTYPDPVTGVTCGRQMVCPKGPVLESLGVVENDDSDNIVNWGILSR